MTGNVIDLVSFKKAQEPHAAGQAFCMGCGHTWAGVAAIGVTELECPGCHAFKGRFKFEFSPGHLQEVRECNCGNQLFYLTREGHMCPNCGTYQSY